MVVHLGTMRHTALAALTLTLLACTAETADVAQQEDELISCGQRLDDRTAGLTPLLDDGQLEVVAELPYPPGNVTLSGSGRLFFSFHPEGNKSDIQVAELVDGEVVPFPSAAFQEKLHSVLSIRIDRLGRLWMLDYGDYGLHRPRLFAFDVESGELLIDYSVPRSASGLGSMFNDFQVSPDGNTVYIADQSTLAQDQAIVVIDFGREHPIARRRLHKHESVRGGDYDVFIDDRRVKVGGVVCPGYGLDAIAIDQSGDSLFYASLNSGEMYRVSTFDLRYQDSLLLDEQLAAQTEHFADITMSDGIATDHAGHIYLTDMEHSALMRVNAAGDLEMLIQSERLRWPDGLGWGPDGHLYVTASALHEYLPELVRSDQDIARGAPYHILRLLPQSACNGDVDCTGTVGH